MASGPVLTMSRQIRSALARRDEGRSDGADLLVVGRLQPSAVYEEAIRMADVIFRAVHSRQIHCFDRASSARASLSPQSGIYSNCG